MRKAGPESRSQGLQSGLTPAQRPPRPLDLPSRPRNFVTAQVGVTLVTDTPPKAAISNGALARTTGMNHSMISRLRSGLRRPSIHTMSKIEEHVGWSVEEQARALANDAYPATLEATLVDKFGREGNADE